MHTPGVIFSYSLFLRSESSILTYGVSSGFLQECRCVSKPIEEMTIQSQTPRCTLLILTTKTTTTACQLVGHIGVAGTAQAAAEWVELSGAPNAFHSPGAIAGCSEVT